MPGQEKASSSQCLLDEKDFTDEVPVKKKTPTQKDNNASLRQEQISAYRKETIREERERRVKLRHLKDNLSDFDTASSSENEQSPKKKKKVSFDIRRDCKREETLKR